MRARVFYTATGGVGEGELAALRRRLPDEDVRHADGFRAEEDRRLQLVARGHVRGVLAECGAGECAIVRTSAGKPGLMGSGLEFSYAHTRGMVVSVVTEGVACGIDVEDCSRRVDMGVMAPEFCGASELAAWRALGMEAGRFFALWTLKEAYSKAVGLGLGLDFREVEFAVEGGRARLLDGRGGWTFALVTVEGAFQVAVAVAGEVEIGAPERWMVGGIWKKDTI